MCSVNITGNLKLTVCGTKYPEKRLNNELDALLHKAAIAWLGVMAVAIMPK